MLHEAGLPAPETVVCERVDEAMAAVRAMGDVVIKPLFGSMGHGLVRVSDPDVAFRVLRALEQMQAVFYVQRAIDHGGRDVRVFVVGGRVHWRDRAAGAGGGVAHERSRRRRSAAVELPPEWSAARLCAPRRVGADYAGVDLLPGRGRGRLRAGGERHPGMAGLAAGDGAGRRGVDRGAAGRRVIGTAAGGRGPLPA